MSNLNDFLDGIEKLAYRVLLWGLIIPKTLLKIIFESQWIAGYVKEQLHLDEAKPVFDKYISPVVLFIVVTLIPAVMLSFVPQTGMSIAQPTPLSDENLREIFFTVNGKFLSSTERVYHRVRWEIYEVQHTDSAGNPAYVTFNYKTDNSIGYFDERGEPVEKPNFVFVTGRLQDEAKGIYELYEVSPEITLPKEEKLYRSQMVILDTHTIQDYFSWEFPEGEYQARVKIENYDSATDLPLETFQDTIYITVPPNESQPIYFEGASIIDGEEFLAVTANTGSRLERLKGALESGSIYVLALGLLALPLLFSFGTKLIGPDGISETSMKESFYMQCYYFAPLTTAFWAMYYTIGFSTPDIAAFTYLDILLSAAIFILMLLWFWSAEVRAVMLERNVTRGRARIILFMLGTVLIIGGILVLAITSDMDVLRRYSIFLYPFVAGFILAAYILRRIRDWLRNRRKVVEASPASPFS